MTSFGMDAASQAPTPSAGVAALLRRPPVAAGPEAPVKEALTRMVAERVGCIVIVDGVGARPLGVLTQRDVIERVVLPGGDLAQAVAGVMTGGVVSLPLAASAHQARLSLARHDLRHLVLVDAVGAFAGVVSRGELYGNRSFDADDLVESIQAAVDIATLADAARRVRDAACRMVDEGVAAAQVCEWIAILNDLVVLAAVDLAEAEFDLPLVPWCWLAFGSEGEGYMPIVDARELAGDALTIGDIAITCVDMPHGPIWSTGFRFEHDGKSAGYATDFHDITPEMASLFRGLDLWVVDALREAPHPTHSHLAQTLDAIERLEPAQALLTHMDQSMDYDRLCATLPRHVRPAHDGQSIIL